MTSRRITREQAIQIATNFANQHKISSQRKREDLAILIIKTFYAGYEAGIDDLEEKTKAKTHEIVEAMISRINHKTF